MTEIDSKQQDTGQQARVPQSHVPAGDGAVARDQPEAYGRFVLLNRLGAGGMGEAFRAVVLGPQKFQRVLVVKRILPHVCREPSFIQMFVDEANLSARLSHPNIVQIYEFGSVGDSYFIAMEYVPGRNLSSLLSHLARTDVLMPPALGAEIARQVCMALHYAHTLCSADGKPLGIIHRDVSPANIMVTPGGLVKVLDFGIARAAEGRETSTRAGTIKGKIAYLAPEQIELSSFDHRVDIFALGIVMHEMLTGERLFHAESDMARMHMILERPIVPPSARNPAVKPTLDRIVMRALERDPNRRYATAADMAVDLESFLHEIRVSSRQLPRMLIETLAEPLGAIPGVDLTAEESHSLALARDNSENRISPPGAAHAGWAPAGETRATVVLAGSGRSDADSGAGVTPPLRGEAAPNDAAPRPRPHGYRIIAGVIVGSAGLTGLLTWLALALAHAPTPVPDAPVRPPTLVPATVAISFDSVPQDARVVRVDTGAVVGSTPVSVTLPRGRELVEFLLEREGYAPVVVKVLPDLDKPALVTLKELPSLPEKPPRPPADKAGHKTGASSQTARLDVGGGYTAEQARRGVPMNPFETGKAGAGARPGSRTGR